MIGLLGIILIFAADSASTSSSSAGFFPDNFVNSGMDSAGDETKKTPKTVEEDESPVPPPGSTTSTNWRERQRAAAQAGSTSSSGKRVKAYPGRFVKTQKGVERSKIDNTEWDVSSGSPSF